MKDLSGQRFGLLTVESLAAKTPDNHYAWNCLCECGTRLVVRAANLQHGKRKSCGCVMRAKRSKGTNYRHGMAHSPEWNAWSEMKRRCYDPRRKFYKYYGGRGIKVCARWMESFENFLADMGLKPSPEYSIEREDVDGDYEPGNCSWSPRSRQAVNRTDTVRIRVNGTTKALADWCRETGVSPGTAHKRISDGWDPAVAVTKPSTRKASPCH